MFSEPSLGEELGSPHRSGLPRVGKAALKAVAQPDVGALRQHIQDLKAQLLNANKVIQSLQRRTRSISVTSGYTSGPERPPLCPTVPVSPPHSLTDEDEGWQSDSHGTLCPQRDLEHLVHRVALLEAQLPPAKLGGGFPKELQSATWPGYGMGMCIGMDGGGYRRLQGLPEVVACRAPGLDGVHTSMAPVHAMQCRQLWGPLPSQPYRKYNSLIQAQARELSHLRQTLREGRGVSRSLAQHLHDALRSFEELLRGTDIDYYLGQGFREQLAQGRQLAERLSDKLGTSKCLGGYWVVWGHEEWEGMI